MILPKLSRVQEFIVYEDVHEDKGEDSEKDAVDGSSDFDDTGFVTKHNDTVLSHLDDTNGVLQSVRTYHTRPFLLLILLIDHMSFSEKA